MTDLNTQVRNWVSSGIISPDQGEKILAQQPQPPARGSLVAEALSYVGGVLVLVAALIIASIYWPSMSLGARSALTGGAAALVLAAGVVLPATMGPARRRLRAVLWAMAVVLTGVWIGVTLDGLHWEDETGILIAASSAAVVGFFLWGYQKTVLQQAALGVALAIAAGAAAAHLPRGDEVTVGLTVFGLGLTWLALAWGDLVAPQRCAYILGGAAVIFGGQLTTRQDWGFVLAAVSVAALVAAAVLIRDLWLLAVGAVGVLITVPAIIDRYFSNELAAPLALLGAGASLIALGVFIARRRTTAAQRAAVTIPARYAVALAIVVLAVMTPVVLISGRLW